MAKRRKEKGELKGKQHQRNEEEEEEEREKKWRERKTMKYIKEKGEDDIGVHYLRIRRRKWKEGKER